MADKRYGFVCPEWAVSLWDPLTCSIKRTVLGDFAVVDSSIQYTIFLAKTAEECARWLKENGDGRDVYEEDYLPEPEDPEVALLKEACGPGAVVTRIG